MYSKNVTVAPWRRQAAKNGQRPLRPRPRRSCSAAVRRRSRRRAFRPGDFRSAWQWTAARGATARNSGSSRNCSFSRATKLSLISTRSRRVGQAHAADDVPRDRAGAGPNLEDPRPAGRPVAPPLAEHGGRRNERVLAQAAVRWATWRRWYGSCGGTRGKRAGNRRRGETWLLPFRAFIISVPSSWLPPHADCRRQFQPCGRETVVPILPSRPSAAANSRCPCRASNPAPVCMGPARSRRN